METGFLCEQKLKREDPALHLLFTNSVVCMQQMLNKYQVIFPTYTDHTVLHSLEVIDFCNLLIGERIDQLNADEIYVLLMSAYLHDSGMGITQKDFQEFSRNLSFGDYFERHPDARVPDIIRDFHQEFSGAYIKKYAEVFEIPSAEHIFAIVQTSRGHRKTDLSDSEQYPSDYQAPNGNRLCLPYLAVLLRLADELDIAAERNLQFMYDESAIDNEYSRMEFRKHRAIRRVTVTEEAFFLDVNGEDAEAYREVEKMVDKLTDTLNECRQVAESRTPFRISQKRVLMRMCGGNRTEGQGSGGMVKTGGEQGAAGVNGEKGSAYGRKENCIYRN
ncbi:MAG: HD domain-containing protein [Clostridiales bacterium]|nr:HD domain-containing protein [Clostridiales bacterium]